MGWIDRIFGRTNGRVPAGSDAAPAGWLLSLKRAAWIPEVTDGDGSPICSKFCGTPWLAEGEDWPRCGYCREPMPLLVQVNSTDLPHGAEHAFGGMLQLFYCVNLDCGADLQAWEGFGKNQLARLVPDPGAVPVKPFPGSDLFPSQQVVGWSEIDDYPNFFEAKHLRPGECGDHPDKRHAPQQGDKLLGWPDWVQNVEYVACPDCGKPMRYVFQVASEDHVPYMFGDGGVGHVSYCPDHPQRVAFRWACC